MESPQIPYHEYAHKADREATLRGTLTNFLVGSYGELSHVIDRNPLFTQRFFEEGSLRTRDLMDDAGLEAFYQKELAYALGYNDAKRKILQLIENNPGEKELIIRLCAETLASAILLKLAGADFREQLLPGTLERETSVIRQALEQVLSNK